MKESCDITQYSMSEMDRTIKNPFLEEVLDVVRDLKARECDVSMELNIRRGDIIMEYAFSIPCYSILEKIAHYSPILEIGAGSGYWAMCLSELGADVIALDKRPPEEAQPWDWQSGNAWFDDTWYAVDEGDEKSAALFPDRALFMAWPMPFDPMAYNTLHHYKKAGGHTLIYLGDPKSSGDERFHDELKKHKLLEEHEVMGWPRMPEVLQVYSLK